ncbi:MAG: sulfite exporter TauE/SafE family protein [Rhodoluna sp.]|nr:sulfite exporter TauE/SafE family protein [Rhodoluna sp.]
MWVLLLVSVAGFLAQLVDGAMGMAFGVTSTSLLLFLAYNPAAASAVVHLAEIATSSISGISHIRFGNVDWHALIKVAVPGAFGAFVGAVLLSNVDLSSSRPWTATVLLALGSLILYRFTRPTILGKKRRARARWLAPLGLVGGFVDSTGGGGWGPVVTTSLTASNALEPRKAIGTTNTAEFAISLAASIGFLLGLGAEQIPWDAVVALLIGGVIGAPVAAWLVSKAPQRMLGILVGNLIVLLNVRQLVISLEANPTVTYVAFSVVVALFAFSLTAGFKHLKTDRKEH